MTNLRRKLGKWLVDLGLKLNPTPFHSGGLVHGPPTVTLTTTTDVSDPKVTAKVVAEELRRVERSRKPR